VGSRAAANKAGKRVDPAQLPFLFPSLLVVTTTVTCNNRKRTTQSILIFCFCFADLLLWFGFFLQLSVFFSFPLLLCFQAGAVGSCASVESGRLWEMKTWFGRRVLC
jgi:hypothetical protein